MYCKTLKFIFTPLGKIVAASGNSSIYGKIVSENNIFSPITKTPCTYCVYRTFQLGITRRFKRPPGTAQVMFGSGVKYENFFLEDTSGKILVQINKAPVYQIPHKIRLDDFTTEYKDALSEFKITTNIGEGQRREYEEDIVLSGDNVYVNGTIKIENSEKVIYADLISYKSTRRTGLHPMGIIVVLTLIILGIRYLLKAF